MPGSPRTSKAKPAPTGKPTPRKRKKAPAKPRKPPAIDAAARDQVVLLLVAGVSRDAAAAAARSELKVPAAQVERTVAAAEEAIVRAATADRTQALGVAIRRLNDLYTTALEDADLKSALSAQRELNKLLALTEVGNAGELEEETEEDSEAVRTLAAIEAHLRPLGLGPENYPLVELARMVAGLIMEARD